jgi:YD repeat-containing protein
MGQQAPARWDQPEPPGSCHNNLYGDDCNLAQTNLSGPVHTVEFWMDRDLPQPLHMSHETRTFFQDGLLIDRVSHDPDGRLLYEQKYSYDAQGRRTAIEMSGPADVDNSTETRTYDAQGRVIALEVRRSRGNAFLERWTYNAAGLPLTADIPTSRDHTEYQYDDSGRLVAEWKRTGPASNPKLPDLRFSYGPSGSRRVSNFDDNSYCRKPDALASLPNFTTDETRDASGHLLKTVVTYTEASKDGCFRPPDPAPGRTEYEYDASGRETSQRHFDAEGKLVSRSVKTYDSHGNLTSIATFDELAKPRSKQTSAATMSYTYDSHGNWTLKTSRFVDGQNRVTLSETTHRVITYFP